VNTVVHTGAEQALKQLIKILKDLEGTVVKERRIRQGAR
jgi:7,8-dihydro-6-hydroxymethylpterin-pyrophosphokinase